MSILLPSFFLSKLKDDTTIREYDCRKLLSELTPHILSVVLSPARRLSYRKTLALVSLFLCSLFVRLSYCAEPDFSRLADAIYLAEGAKKASRPYGIFYKGCDWSNPAYCRKICLNTLRNNYKRWNKAGNPGTFLTFLASRYAPVSAHPLNRFWLSNVRYFLQDRV